MVPIRSPIEANSPYYSKGQGKQLVYGAGDSADPVAHIDPDREPVTHRLAKVASRPVPAAHPPLLQEQIPPVRADPGKAYR